MRKSLFVVLVAGLVLAAGSAQAQRPDAPPYARRGPYPVGTQEITIDDGQGAPLNVTVWYPALNPDGAEESTSYRYGLLSLPGRALRDAAPYLEEVSDLPGGPYPLVVFSHGNGGLRLQSLYFTEHLASYGFVVAAADHPGNTIQDALLNRDAFTAALIKNFGTRPLDVLRLIDYVDAAAQPGGSFAGLVDMERIAVSGHSFGGYTALAAGGARISFDALQAWCRSPLALDPGLDGLPLPASVDRAALRSMVCFMRDEAETVAAARGLEAAPDGLWPATTDPRIDAAVLMAPYHAPLFGPEGLAAFDIPALFLVGSADDVTVPVRDAYVMVRDIASAEKTIAVFENGSHYLFVDACSEAAIRLGQFERCSDAVWDMARVHDLINHLATAFLLSQLYGDAEAADALLPENVDFTGVVYQRHGAS